ncbi:probable chitinase 10 [Centruroides sculpturatus]|uniref:probable chitinase 10 n=1 Tax=Centruroides sculpturatus TaxID=218467 RepID=UPI000C6DFEFC|nr:probable chitinase 10 [Centruroides sculpturatus]
MSAARVFFFSCLTLTVFFNFGTSECPNKRVEDPNDAYAYYERDVRKECPPNTAFDSSTRECTESKWKSLTDEPKHRSKRSSGDEMKIVCYFISWGINRESIAKFTAEDIDPFLCTHIIYAFASLDKDDLIMIPGDKRVDVDEGTFKSVVEVKKKNPKLKVLLAIGGWVESGGDKYSRMVRDSDRRKKFVKEAVELLKKYKFDGLDLDWEYPACWQGDCKNSDKNDKENFAKLLKELRKAFDKESPSLLLTAAVSAGMYVSDHAYDGESMAKYLDFINVMTYDYHNFNDGKTGHHAPFKAHPEDPDKKSNVMSSMKYWSEEKKIPKKKLIMGVPAYGRTFRLVNPSNHGLFDPTNGSGIPGQYTKEGGSLSYTEILKHIKEDGWKMERDSYVGPYAYKGDQWVGFDDPVAAKDKARYAKDVGYGGVMVWELSSDNFRGLWGDRKYPLINSLKEGVGNGAKINLNNLILVTVLLVCNLILWKSFAFEGKKEIVCSLSDWAQYRPGRGKFTLDDVDPNLCTIINYSFGFLDKKKLVVDVKNKEFLQNFSRKFASLKKKHPNLKTVLAVGGWSDSEDGRKYSRLVKSIRNRRNFIDGAVEFLNKYDFNGLDLNWEYPVCWHARCDDSREREKYQYGVFIKELRDTFDHRGLTISASVSGSKYIIDKAYDVPVLGRSLHLINVLTYDFAGTYRNETGHNSAMSYVSGDTNPHLNTDYALNYWIKKGAPRNKLTVGVAVFGRSFTLLDKKKNGLYAPIKGKGRAAEYTDEPGFMGYNEVCQKTSNENWTVRRVPGVGPYAFKGDQWVSYDDPLSAAQKGKYARENGFAGVKIWELTTDDFGAYCCGVTYPLLRALNYGLRNTGSAGNDKC